MHLPAPREKAAVFSALQKRRGRGSDRPVHLQYLTEVRHPGAPMKGPLGDKEDPTGQIEGPFAGEDQVQGGSFPLVRTQPRRPEVGTRMEGQPSSKEQPAQEEQRYGGTTRPQTVKPSIGGPQIVPRQREQPGMKEEDEEQSSNSTMGRTPTSPRMGSRRQECCECYTWHGSHGCRLILDDGESTHCCWCSVINPVTGGKECHCGCDQCSEEKEIDAMVEARIIPHER